MKIIASSGTVSGSSFQTSMPVTPRGVRKWESVHGRVEFSGDYLANAVSSPLVGVGAFAVGTV